MPAQTASIGRCFLCDRTSDQVVWREQGIDGRLCECGMLYADVRGYEPERFDLSIELHQDGFYALSASLKARWMARHCSKGKLLEVGCGEPSFLQAARKLGYQIHGMEPHPARARRVSQQLGIPVEQAFIEDDSLPAASFDVVYHCDLLAHFPDPLGALASMIRLLRPGGALCFEVGILGGISPTWYRLIGGIDFPQHLFLYSSRALANLMDRAGLDVRHRTTYGLAPQVLLHRPAGAFANRVIRPVLSATGIRDSSDKALRFLGAIDNFARYRLGRVAPNIGPLTILMAARPGGRR